MPSSDMQSNQFIPLEHQPEKKQQHPLLGVLVGVTKGVTVALLVCIGKGVCVLVGELVGLKVAEGATMLVRVGVRVDVRVEVGVLTDEQLHELRHKVPELHGLPHSTAASFVQILSHHPVQQ